MSLREEESLWKNDASSCQKKDDGRIADEDADVGLNAVVVGDGDSGTLKRRSGEKIQIVCV